MAKKVGGFLKKILPLLGPDLEENTNTLQRKVKLLGSRKVDVLEELVGESYRQGKKRRNEVGDWLLDVEIITSDFETLKGEVLSNKVYNRQMLNEEVETMTKEADELVEQSCFTKGLFCDTVDTSDFLHRSIDRYVDHLCTLLENDSVSKIGICETGELGRNTLSDRINEKLSNESTFLDHVYQVGVSIRSSTYTLQSEIARALSLDLSCENDERKRANLLSEEFKKKGRFLLILDNVRKQINTEEIGIPLGKGCKLIITSRSEQVCKQTECQRIIQVSRVSEQEACKLLLKKLSSVQLQQ